MKIFISLLLVIVSAISSMVGFINTVSFNHTDSAPVIMFLLGLILIGVAGTIRHRA